VPSVGAYEAETHLPKLLERVAGGQRITITKHGVAVAVLQPVSSFRNRDPRVVIDEIGMFRRGRKLRGLRLKEMIEQGRAK
jgi:prevent-host-death family protein